MSKFFKGGFLAALLFFPSFVFSLDHVLVNEKETLNLKVVEKLQSMGEELYDKTGVFVAVAIGDDTSLEALLQIENKLNSPYILLALSKSSRKVDIISSKEASVFFDKNEVLNRSIVPILASTKGKDIYNASILNGYADIIDQVAAYFNVKLESSVGNANRDTLNILRIIFYGFILIAVLYFVQGRMKRKRIR
ncbi:hypothetical protein DMB92_05115 [Campylobacter sp. MIT 99-7217]|uniref:hypothetical protein n=1 Tax=Campylobacter sp. MIT 99-7217 TaxID=535091 RepID=UPI00115B54A6|nr:hypothetical protein [Campylobacter sp. MIT 99-7217]TQR32478.1 hypothetical protein DMB92_05115 [Campylobacter sp. MIT 99-7217]